MCVRTYTQRPESERWSEYDIIIGTVNHMNKRILGDDLWSE